MESLESLGIPENFEGHNGDPGDEGEEGEDRDKRDNGEDLVHQTHPDMHQTPPDMLQTPCSRHLWCITSGKNCLQAPLT